MVRYNACLYVSEDGIVEYASCEPVDKNLSNIGIHNEYGKFFSPACRPMKIEEENLIEIVVDVKSLQQVDVQLAISEITGMSPNEIAIFVTETYNARD